jgi:hypothetical protein
MTPSIIDGLSDAWDADKHFGGFESNIDVLRLDHQRQNTVSV